MRRLFKAHRLNGKAMLDYGCGRGIDADTYGLDKFDPHYYNDTNAWKVGKYDVITCNYVLNVIDSQAERDAVLANIKILLKKGGIAYITVRRDIKSEGYTSRGTYQENIQLNLPILWENSTYCTYMLTY
jgi:2-polyprenyl-3-methyl-5-hydroxy-6-metoxy-1,4-benzoquinol methylase